jgi:hypothetical protein
MAVLRGFWEMDHVLIVLGDWSVRMSNGDFNASEMSCTGVLILVVVLALVDKRRRASIYSFFSKNNKNKKEWIQHRMTLINNNNINN